MSRHGQLTIPDLVRAVHTFHLGGLTQPKNYNPRKLGKYHNGRIKTTDV